MKEDLIDPHVQFPGLQIFSSWKNSSKNVRSLQNTPNRSTFNSPFLTSEETLAFAIQNDNSLNQFGPWMKFTDRKSVELHDYSPTVVGSDFFERYDSSQKSETSNFWKRVVCEVFKELPDSSNDQFTEEFQYTVISSDFLNDPNGFRFSFTGKKSIMDFHKRSPSFHRHELATVPTKYGRLKVSSSGRFTLIRTLDFLTTVFAARKVLRCLMKSGVNGGRRVLASVLIALYLAIQQEYFHTQYTRYKALVSLKKMLSSLQKLSKLLHNYRTKLKELSIYKPFSTSTSIAKSDPTVAKIKDILNSCLDLLYYKLRTMTENLVALCSTASLTKYCAMYSLEMSDLFHYLNETAIEVEDKFERVSVMRKFMLCTILSLCCCNSSSDEAMINILSKLFPDSAMEICETPHVRDIHRYRTVTENLEQVEEFVIQLTSSLINHKSVLHSFDDLSRLNDDNLISHSRTDSLSKNRQLSQTLASLRKLESLLIASQEQEISREMKDVVTNHLQEITSAWQSYDTPKNQCNRTFLSSPNQGFSLNVLRKASSPKLNSTTKNGNIRLGDSVTFEQVDDTQSDIEFDSEHEHHDSYEDSRYDNSAHSEAAKLREGRTEAHRDLRKLTDEELRNKLNEGISRLAVENRQGRDKIRTQKSFELLRQKDITKRVYRHASIMTKDRMTLVKSRPPNESNFSSEDSIPVLYELEGLLERQQ